MKNNYGYYVYIDNEKFEKLETTQVNKISIFSIKYYISFLIYIIKFAKNICLKIIKITYNKILKN